MHTGTALVTGASAGVGREIARILAARGWNLVLVARSLDKLNALKAELTAAYGVRADCFMGDLSNTATAGALKAFCDQSGIAVDLLVNNAGAGLFGESVELGERAVPLLTLNIVALTQLCALFGKAMKERGHGAILNIGSLAGNQPTAFFASYAASKSYVLNYSLALRQELAPYGVTVTCVQPGYIRTEFDENCQIPSEKYKRFSYKHGMTAAAVAGCAVRAVFARRSYVRAGVANKIAAFCTGFIPRGVLAQILAKSVQSLVS